MASLQFSSIREASELLDLKYDTVARRASRHRKRHPDTSDVVLDSEGRVLISSVLIDTWKQPTTEVPEGHRTDRDHVVAERDLLQQTLNHTSIELQHLEIKRRDDRIAELESQLEVEKARVRALSATIEAFGRTITDLAQ